MPSLLLHPWWCISSCSQVTSSFFEWVLTQVLTVFARIAARLERSLSPTTIVQAPTIARLAEFIRPTTGTVGSQSLVILRASGMGPPLSSLLSLDIMA
jgi:hypothetical protein